MALRYYFVYSLSLILFIGTTFLFNSCSSSKESAEEKPDIIKENEEELEEDTTATGNGNGEKKSTAQSKAKNESEKQDDKLQLKYKNESTTVTIPLDIKKDNFVLELQGMKAEKAEDKIRRDSVILKDSLVQKEMSKRINEVLKYFRQAQDLFYRRDYKGAMEMVDKSLKVQRTAEALGLKGSIFFMQDNMSSARYYWNRAVEMDSEVPVPDIPELEGLVKEIKTSENKEDTE